MFHQLALAVETIIPLKRKSFEGMPRPVVLAIKRYGAHLIFMLFYLCALTTGIMGIDFGFHWDEFKIIDSVKESVNSGVYLPGWYNYPSVSYAITLFSILPHTAYFIVKRLPGEIRMEEIGQFMHNYLNDPGIYVDVRRFFLIIVLLSALWIYLLIFTWRRSWWEALFGALVFLASWEMAYHARWIAPDAVMMQFGILTILLVFVALRKPRDHKLIWLGLAALTAGLTAGTKYYGGLFLVPVLLGALDFSGSRKNSYSTMLAISAFLGAVFLVSFLLSTPAAFITPGRLIADVGFEIDHYRAGHGGYTVNSSLQHAVLLLIYLASEIFSKFTPSALILFGFSIAGLYWMISASIRDRNHRFQTIVFLSVPVLFFPFIISQKVMIVRNELLILPFLAVACARGVSLIDSKLERKFFRPVFIGIICTLLLVNMAHQFTSAYTVMNKEKINYTQTLIEYMQAHPIKKYYLSSSILKMLEKPELSSLPNLVFLPAEADYYLFSSRDVAEWWLLPANQKGLYGVVSGPDDVNFDYYPTWAGQFRVVSLPMDIAIRSAVIR